ncbi:acyl-CoA reductase [Sphingobacterium chuzhouense]|uniref:Acyl-CoA reductase n=1 Tax=Sphingobacterium chuzhouense TaxID=1742264 RepID=A0ABR7XQP8_9SPHI|nr:acyl-CoA reductase [Sphingobacterium chuzhouense]MBD1421501.1 acyl-CoA reductase [Sphingobacterium chuzhouense]
MTQKQRIDAFVALGKLLASDQEKINRILQQASFKNPWYTVENTRKQFQALSSNLTAEKLMEWVAPYPTTETDQVVGLILAGNIPLVGFQDILSVLIAGFSAQIKLSSDDAGLTTFVLHELIEIEPAFAEKIQIVDRLQQYDLIIATGSNNSSRYFDYYFGKKPNIIRKNRNSIAILTGTESPEQLKALGFDIFDYFGLGCRSVSKLYVPRHYDFHTFFEAIEDFSTVKEHHKYTNNYDYNKSIYLINGEKHFDNGFMLLKEDTGFASPLATVFYEEYDQIHEVVLQLEAQADKIQCIVSEATIETSISTFPLGGSQCPSLTDYADGVDVMAFLSEKK